MEDARSGPEKDWKDEFMEDARSKGLTKGLVKSEKDYIYILHLFIYLFINVYFRPCEGCKE